MKAVDTNVLARWLLIDDAKHHPLAVEALSEPCYVSLSVLMELGWVLEKRLGHGRARVADFLQTLVNLETISVPDHKGVAWAIDRYRNGADWADMLHLVSATPVTDRFATFDTGILQDAGPTSPVTIETLGL